MTRLIEAFTLFLSTGLLFAGQQSGVVRWSGEPIPGVTVIAVQGERKVVTTTNESGRYVLDKLDPGVWTVETQMFGFDTQQRQLTIGDQPSTTEWTLELKPEAPLTLADNAPKAVTPAAAAPATAPSPAAAPKAATPAAAATAKPSMAAAVKKRGAAAQQDGTFRNLRMNENADAQMPEGGQSSAEGMPQGPDASAGSEAFLVNGSLSGGLQAPPDDSFGRSGFDRHGEFGDSPFGGDRGSYGSDRGGFGSDRGSSGGDRGSSSGRGSFGGGSSGRGGGPPSMSSRGGFSSSHGGPGGEHHHSSRSGSSSFGNRSGSRPSSIRGSASFTLGNSAVNARPYSLTGQELVEPAYSNSRVSVVAGGPLLIPKLFKSEKTFFFVSYFGTRSKSPNSGFATLPSPLERTGDFSQSYVQGPVTVADPVTHQPFPGNLIPVSRMNPAALGLLSYFPLPNQPGSVQNYRLLTANPANSDNLGTRISQTLNAKDRLSVSFNMSNRNGNNSQLFGFHDNSTGRGEDLRLSWTHTFKSRQYNSLSVSFNRNSSSMVPFFAYSQDVAGQLGIQGTSNSPINYGPPNLSFTNFGGLSDASASVSHNQTWTLGDGFSIMRGRHTITIGGGRTHLNNNSVSDQNARGSFTFSGLSTSTFDASGFPLKGSGYDFADFLMGLPQSSSIRFGSADTYFRTSSYNLYTADDFRALSNLSFNFGLRYEYFEPYTEKYGRMANLDIAPDFTGVAVVTPGQTGPYSGTFPAGLINSDPTCFSPRVGLAWRPLPKHHLTIRTGYGIFFNGSAIARFPSRMAAQPPFAKSASVNTSAAQVLTLQNGFATTPSETITNTFAVSKFYRVGYSQSWNFSLQQELPRSFTMELTYLGNKGTGLDIQRLPNRATPGSPLTAEQRRQIGNATGFTYTSPEGNSIYHAAQARVTRRFRSGVSMYTTYTFAKTIDNSSSFGGAGNSVAQNDRDLSAERGLSSFDTRHSVSTSYVLTSPVGEKAIFMRTGGLAAKLLQDWTLTGSVSARSGRPFTARVLGNLSDSTGSGSVGSGRAQATGLPVEASSGFFNLAAFTIPPTGQYGNAARNTIPGPGSFSLNVSFGRSFNLGDDRHRLEFRFTGDNVLNHPNLAGFNTVVNASNYGWATAVGGMRNLSAMLRFRF